MKPSCYSVLIWKDDRHLMLVGSFKNLEDAERAAEDFRKVYPADRVGIEPFFASSD